MKIDRLSPTPLYQQLANTLRQQIVSGSSKYGAALPPETELVRKYRVSRVTARGAVDLLSAEGLVVRKQGKGTYVCAPKIQQDLGSLQGFAELMAARGSEQSMQVAAFERVAANEVVSSALRVPLGDQVLLIKRRHFLRDLPIAFALIYLPSSLAKSVTLKQVSSKPIYTLLRERAGIRIKRATQVVRALGADQDVAHMLGQARGAPTMMVERVTFSADEVPVEYILFYYRADSYELTVELHREPSKNLMLPTAELGVFAFDG